MAIEKVQDFIEETKSKDCRKKIPTQIYGK